MFALTSGTEDLSIDGVRYHAKGGFSPAASVETSQSLSVDSLEIEAILDDDGITEDDLRRGLFDGAGIDVFLINWKNPSQGGAIMTTAEAFNCPRNRGTFRSLSRPSLPVLALAEVASDLLPSWHPRSLAHDELRERCCF